MITKRSESTFNFDAAGGTGLNLTTVPLKQIYDDRKEFSFVIEVLTNGTAPGTDKTLTFYFASTDSPVNGAAYTAAELSTASEVYALALEDAGDTRRVYVVPNARSVGPYMHYWFDLTALDGGAALNVNVKLMSNPER